MYSYNFYICVYSFLEQIFVFKSEKKFKNNRKNVKKKKKCDLSGKFRDVSKPDGREGGMTNGCRGDGPASVHGVHTVSGEPHNSNVFHAHIDPYCPPSPPNKPSFQGLQITSLITMNEFI